MEITIGVFVTLSIFIIVFKKDRSKKKVPFALRTKE